MSTAEQYRIKPVAYGVFSDSGRYRGAFTSQATAESKHRNVRPLYDAPVPAMIEALETARDTIERMYRDLSVKALNDPSLVHPQVAVIDGLLARLKGAQP